MRRISLLAALGVAGLLAVAAVAWACVPSSGLFVTPYTGPAGSSAEVSGRGTPRPVDLYWDRDPQDTSGPAGPKLGEGNPTPYVPETGEGGDFRTTIQIPPDASDGCHNIVAVTKTEPYLRSVAVFAVGRNTCSIPGSVDAPVVVPAPPAATPTGPGPAISGSALSKANGTRRVSRSGRFTLFCGRFSEAGVTGVCGGESTSSISLRSRRPRRSGSKLLLGTKEFLSQPGRPTNVKFRLNRGNLALLKAAGRVRMRGTVEAIDVFGNASKASFRFTLKAPRRSSR